MEDKQKDSFLQMHLDYDGGNILRETVRWSRFLSIVGIIGLSICLLAFIIASKYLIPAFSRLVPGIDDLENVAGALIMVVILIFGAVFGFLVYMLYRFSVLIRKGIEHQDQAVFAEGMKCLKIYFLVSGIIAVLSLLSNLSSLIKLF